MFVIKINFGYFPCLQALKRLSTAKSPKPSDTVREHTSLEVLQSDVTPDKDKGTLSSDNEGNPSAKFMVQTSSELYNNSQKDNPRVPSSEPFDTDLVKHDADQEAISATVSNAETQLAASNGEVLNENASDVHVEHPPSLLATKDVEVVGEDHLTDGRQNIESQSSDVPSKTDQERSQPVVPDSPVKTEAQLKEDDVKVETPVNQKTPQERNDDTPPTKVQDQLDEVTVKLKLKL